MLYHIILYHTIFDHTILQYITIHLVILYYIIFHYIIIYHVTLYCIILYYIILYYIYKLLYESILYYIHSNMNLVFFLLERSIDEFATSNSTRQNKGGSQPCKTCWLDSQPPTTSSGLRSGIPIWQIYYRILTSPLGAINEYYKLAGSIKFDANPI